MILEMIHNDDPSAKYKGDSAAGGERKLIGGDDMFRLPIMRVSGGGMKLVHLKYM